MCAFFTALVSAELFLSHILTPLSSCSCTVFKKEFPHLLKYIIPKVLAAPLEHLSVASSGCLSWSQLALDMGELPSASHRSCSCTLQLPKPCLLSSQAKQARVYRFPVQQPHKSYIHLIYQTNFLLSVWEPFSPVLPSPLGLTAQSLWAELSACLILPSSKCYWACSGNQQRDQYILLFYPFPSDILLMCWKLDFYFRNLPIQAHFSCLFIFFFSVYYITTMWTLRYLPVLLFSQPKQHEIIYIRRVDAHWYLFPRRTCLHLFKF